MQFYIDESRENETYSLPDGEVFWADAGEWGVDRHGERCEPTDDDCEELNEAGFYWWACFPGCLPDSDPTGPFATEAEAIAHARELCDC